MSWTTPTSPSVGTQAASSWADLVTADLALIASPAYFLATYALNSNITSGTNFPYGTIGTIVEDSLSGWNNTNNNYVCKSAGLYLVELQCGCGATAGYPVPLFNKNGTLMVAGGSAGTGVSGGGGVNIVVRLAVNDTVAMQANSNYTTHASAKINYLALTQLSWV